MQNGKNNASSQKCLFLFPKEVLMKDSVNILKKYLCTAVLSALNSSYQTSSDPFSSGLVSFCNSSDTLLEAFLQTLNQVK